MENMDITKINLASFLKKANKGQPVKRCLFGPVDHTANAQFLQKQREMQEEDSKAKWNFDFSTMTPLSGSYVWEKVGENEVDEIPSAYSLPQLTARNLYRPRTPLGLIATVNHTNIIPATTNIIAEPTVSKVSKRLDFETANSESVDPLRGDKGIEDEQTISTEQNTTESSQQQTSVHRKPVSRKRPLQQTIIPEYFQIKKRRSAFSHVRSSSKH